jgi:hypothetical protein
MFSFWLQVVSFCCSKFFCNLSFASVWELRILVILSCIIRAHSKERNLTHCPLRNQFPKLSVRHLPLRFLTLSVLRCCAASHISNPRPGRSGATLLLFLLFFELSGMGENAECTRLGNVALQTRRARMRHHCGTIIALSS